MNTGIGAVNGVGAYNSYNIGSKVDNYGGKRSVGIGALNGMGKMNTYNVALLIWFLNNLKYILLFKAKS